MDAMEPVYHLVLPVLWNDPAQADYRAASLDSEGFIHCSYAGQVEASANRFYAGAERLLLLCIDPGRLSSPLKVEPAGSGQMFPHIYGPINRDAVTGVREMRRDGGTWVFPS